MLVLVMVLMEEMGGFGRGGNTQGGGEGRVSGLHLSQHLAFVSLGKRVEVKCVRKRIGSP